MNWEHLAQLPIIALGVLAGNLLTKEIVHYRNRRQWMQWEERARRDADRINRALEGEALARAKRAN